MDGNEVTKTSENKILRSVLSSSPVQKIKGNYKVVLSNFNHRQKLKLELQALGAAPGLSYVNIKHSEITEINGTSLENDEANRQET